LNLALDFSVDNMQLFGRVSVNYGGDQQNVSCITQNNYFVED